MAGVDACPLVRDGPPPGHVRGRGRRAVAPLALRYGATQYSVHRSRDDRYKITQMAWFESKHGLVPLLGRPGDDRVPAPATRASTRSRSPTPGTTSWSPARSAPRSALEPEPAPPPSPAPAGGRLTVRSPTPVPEDHVLSLAPVTRTHKIVNLIGVPLPLVGLIAAIVLLWNGDRAARARAAGRPVRRDRARRDARLPPDVHPPRVRVEPRVPRDRRRARLDGGAGIGDHLGRRPPQAPRVHRPGGRPALART